MQINSMTMPWMIWKLFLITAMILLGCSDPEVDSQLRLQSAKEYIAKNSPREAMLALKNALQVYPENAEARYLLGLLNLDIGETAAAQKEFRRAKQAGWNEEEVQIGLARVAMNSNNFKRMIEDIEIKETYSATTQANLYAMRAMALARLGLRNQADKVLAEGAAMDANAYQISKTTINFLLFDKKYEIARQKLTEVFKIFPDNPELLLLSGIVALRDGDIPTWTTANKRVIELEPSNNTTIYGRQARLRLIRMQIIEKQFEQANTMLKPLFAQYGDDPETNYLGGILAFAEGNYDLAEERLLKVFKFVPDHLHSQLLFGTVSFQQKDYEQAAHYLSRYLSRVPQNLGVRKLLGQTYMLLDQSNKAKEILKVAMDNSADDAELLTLVGLNDLRAGDMASGIESLEKSLETAPENVPLRKELAKAYLQTGETEQAIKELNALLAQENGQGNTQALLILAQLKGRHPENAINTALGMLAENPQHPAVITLVGNVYAATGDKINARDYYNKTLELSPEYPQANLSLARLEEIDGNLSRAESIYKRTVGVDVKSTIPLLALARIANKKGDREGMYEWLDKARVNAPEQLQPRLILAEAYLQDMRFKDAKLVVMEAKEIAPKNIKVLAQWGRLLLADKHYNEALAIFTELVGLAPDYVYTRVLLAETHLRLGQIKDARNELTSAINIQPDSISVLSILARTEIQLDNYEQAEKYALRIQQLAPENPAGYEIAGNSSFGRKQYDKANIAYAEAWKREQSSDLAIKRSVTVTRLGNPEKGIEILHTWLLEHEGDVKAQQFYATALKDAGKNAEAILVYEKILKHQQDNIIALNNLAWHYSHENNPKALKLAKKAYQVDPDNPSVQDTYGWILVQQGELVQGRTLIEKALEKLPLVAEVQYHYAVAMIKTGEKQKGNDLLKVLLLEEQAFEGREDAEKMLSN